LTIETTPRPLLLGVDVGTSGLRAVLLDGEGHLLDEATSEYETRSPQPGWAEQDPDQWLAALRHALAILWAKGFSASQVSAGESAGPGT
jgi:xylulokinase